MPAPDINLRELACLTKYGQHAWYANRWECLRCKATFDAALDEHEAKLNGSTPLLEYIKRHG